MTIEVAAIFLASSILTMLAAIVWVIAILVINNLVHKYWKPMGIYKMIDPNQSYEVDKDKK